MRGNGLLLKKSGRRLAVALVVACLIGPPAIASSLTGSGVSSPGGTTENPPAIASSLTGSGESSRSGAVGALAASADWLNGVDFANGTFTKPDGVLMETGIRMLVWLVAALTLIPMLLVIVEILAALGLRKRKVIAARSIDAAGKELPSTVVLIPAHNEEDVIGRCLDALSVDLPSDWRMLCVAHNCTDATAEIARNLGAEVIEVQDEGNGGKPDALKAGLRWLDVNPPDIVVIVDADCVVSEGAVRTLATKAYELNRPAMGAYFFAPADSGKGLGTLSSLAVLLKNYIRPQGLHALGMPCLINGSGSAYPFHVIRKAPQGKGAIAEDYQLSIDLLRRGYPTVFVPEARIDGQLPKREDTALRQRRRWEHGHMFLAFHTGPKLLLEGLKRLDKNRIALALEVSVPPLAFLGLMWAIAVGLAFTLFAFYGHGGPLGSLVCAASTFAAAVLVSWMRFAGVKPTLAALWSVPGYFMWKLGMYRDFFTRREKRWVKTSRDVPSAAQHGLRAEIRAPFSG